MTIHGEHGAGWSIYLCGYAEIADLLGSAGVRVDALIVDAPYSEKTHRGHGEGAAKANRVTDADAKRLRVDAGSGAVYAVGENRRRSISYAAWGPDDVAAFVRTLAPVVSGWWASITDHGLVPVWSDALEGAGLYPFAPIPCVESGATVRMTGDGPPNWTTRIVAAGPESAEADTTSDVVVARPKGPPWSRWAVRVDREKRAARPLPGYYLGKREIKPVVGGKPLWLMRDIVRDYSAPGATILDPCAGGGTTLLAAISLGRSALGCEPDPETFEKAVARLRAAEKEIRT
tara:strand:- start:39 stop:905 length:867 start_codon:yes stop_codon:yes gene_type:complete